MAVAIPSEADYGTPVPRGAAAGITGYQATPAAQIDPAPALAAAQSNARELDAVNGEMKAWSTVLETTQAQDALNQLRARRQDLTSGEDGFLSVKGGDVLSKKDADGNTIFQSFPAKMQQAVGDIGGKLMTSRARQLFNDAAANEVTGFKSDVARHGLGESEKYHAAVFKDTTATLTDRAVAATDPVERDGIVQSIGAAARNYASSIGLPGEAAAKGAMSDAYSLIVKKAIATGDNSAIGLFEKYRDQIDAKDQIQLGAAVKTMQIGTIAQDFVRNPSAPTAAPSDPVMKQRVRDGIKFWENDGYSKEVGAGIISNFLHESGFRTDNPNKRDGADGSDSINIAHWNGPRAAAFHQFATANGLDENDVNTGLKFAKSEIDANPALKSALQGAKSASEAAAIFTHGFEKPKDASLRAGERAGTAEKILTDYNGQAPGVASDVRVGDPLATAVNDVSAGRPARTLEGAVNAAMGAPPVAKGDHADGVVNVRQQMIAIEEWKNTKTAENQAAYANNPAQLAANQTQINLSYEQKKGAVTLYKDKLYDSLQQWMTTSGPNGGPALEMPRADILSQFDYNQQKSIADQVERNVAGKKTKTNQEAWTEIYMGLTHPDQNERQKWGQVPLFQYKSILSDDNYQELVKLQATVRNGDDKGLTHVQNINQQANDALLAMGVDPTPKASSSFSSDAQRVARFHKTLQDEVALFEKEKGKPATSQETQRLVDGIVKNVAVQGWFTSSDTRVSDLQYTDIPAQDRTDIENEIRSRGGAPTEQRVLQVYKHVKVREPTQTEIAPKSPRQRLQDGTDTLGVGTAGMGGRRPPDPARAAPVTGSFTGGSGPSFRDANEAALRNIGGN